MGVRRYLSEAVKDGSKVVIQRGKAKAELYRMASNKSRHTTFHHELVWKLRAIGNPYIRPNASIANASLTDDDPILEVPDRLPLEPVYANETYLTNRVLAFERDGWRCTQCGSQEDLQAHHIEPVPEGAFDPMVVHRVENLQTLCAECHNRLPDRYPKV